MTVTAPSIPLDPPAGSASTSIAAAGGTASLLTTTSQVARRSLRKFRRTPQLLVVNTLQGAMFLLIFRYVFGGAIDTGSIPYVDFLIPGFVMTSVLFAGTATSAGVAEDLEGGFYDRLRSLPVSRTALLFGRTVAETGLLVWGLAVTTGIGFAVGFRIHGTVAEGLAAYGLCVLFGFAFTWLFVLLGLVAGNAQAAQGMSLLVFPLTFMSSAYVPVDSLPGWMQPLAENQPITAMVNAVRALALGGADAAHLAHSTAHWVVLSLLWSAGIVLAFAPLAVARYRSSTR
jgi:ABC transporter DrrB family efflux protein